MVVFAAFLASIDNPRHRTQRESVLTWASKTFPDLVPKVAWNQPIFTDHGTFIIDFSAAKNHLAIAPERAAINHFSAEIVQTRQIVQLSGEAESWNVLNVFCI